MIFVCSYHITRHINFDIPALTNNDKTREGVHSEVGTPHRAHSRLSHRVADRRECEPLTQDGQSRAELIDPDVRTAHAARSREGRAAVKHTVIVDRYNTGRSSWVSYCIV